MDRSRCPLRRVKDRAGNKRPKISLAKGEKDVNAGIRRCRSQIRGSLRGAVAILLFALPPVAVAEDVFNSHTVVLDGQGKIVPWSKPAEKAYDQFLRLRWEFIKTRVPNSPGPPPRSSYPQYYFYCAFWGKNGVLEPDTWMNDVGEKIPNWFESARLYYAYTGDSSVMRIIKDLVDYTIQHGTTPATDAWPYFPYTAANAGDMEFRGFSSAGRLALHEVHVDHAGDMGLAFYRMYLYTQDRKYLDAAVHVADALARNARTGTSTQSVWPYRVLADTGKVTAEYAANWMGCYTLLDSLVKAKVGDVRAYESAMAKAREFLLQYPMKTGYWTDGHTDTDVNSHTYKSNMSASNAVLYLLDHPEFDPDWKTHVPELIRWTEENFVFRTSPGEPATQWGANIVGEQDSFLPKMDYQTARYAAACARWYAVSGDAAYKEKAYRSLNWVTYCNNAVGQGFESPVAVKPISNWWSDLYGECPRMFYHAFAGVPEWAPPGENHLLYSESVVRDVSYGTRLVKYTPAVDSGIDYLRLSFLPAAIVVGKSKVSRNSDLTGEGYTVKDIGKGDYAVTLNRRHPGSVSIR